jgi:hypothetical protein
MTRAPWYMRQEFWTVVGMLVVPFFWILPLSRAAYAHVNLRRGRRFLSRSSYPGPRRAPGRHGLRLWDRYGVTGSPIPTAGKAAAGLFNRKRASARTAGPGAR